MKLATFLPFLRRDYVYGLADQSGSLVAHQDILLWGLRSQVVEGAVLFLEHLPLAPVAGQYVRGLAQAALADLPADLASRVETVTIQWFAERRGTTENLVFVTKLPEFGHLAQLRRSTGYFFPICAVVHSVSYPGLAGSFMSLLLQWEPCDAIVATSAAAEKAIRSVIAQVEEILMEACPGLSGLDVQETVGGEDSLGGR